MALLTLYPVDDNGDGFVNNISGRYSGEGFNLASSTSSSNADANVAYAFFDTRDSSTGLTGLTITKVEFFMHCYSYDDINLIAGWVCYRDINQVWGTDMTTPPDISTFFVGTVPESSYGTLVGAGATGWWSMNCNIGLYPIVRTNFTGMAIVPSLGDLGPAHAFFHDFTNTGGFKPYLEITYTPAPVVPTFFAKILGMLGLKKGMRASNTNVIGGLGGNRGLGFVGELWLRFQSFMQRFIKPTFLLGAETQR